MRDTPAIMSLYPSPSHLDPQVWDVSKRVVKFELAGHDGAVVTSLAVASDGLLAASGSTDKTVKVGGVRGGAGARGGAPTPLLTRHKAGVMGGGPRPCSPIAQSITTNTTNNSHNQNAPTPPHAKGVGREL